MTPLEEFEDELTDLVGAAKEVQKFTCLGNKEEIKRWSKFLEQDITAFTRKWAPKPEKTYFCRKCARKSHKPEEFEDGICMACL